MKKLIILNLKDCFNFGMSFNDLAKIEDVFLKDEGLPKLITSIHGDFEFQYGNISKTRKQIGFYTYTSKF